LFISCSIVRRRAPISACRTCRACSCSSVFDTEGVAREDSAGRGGGGGFAFERFRLGKVLVKATAAAELAPALYREPPALYHSSLDPNPRDILLWLCLGNFKLGEYWLALGILEGSAGKFP
jgi:hypothetical protein